ncbi:hypothetical protein Chor_014934, partial [Crotalus horridus]
MWRILSRITRVEAKKTCLRKESAREGLGRLILAHRQVCSSLQERPQRFLSRSTHRQFTGLEVSRAAQSGFGNDEVSGSVDDGHKRRVDVASTLRNALHVWANFGKRKQRSECPCKHLCLFGNQPEQLEPTSVWRGLSPSCQLFSGVSVVASTPEVSARPGSESGHLIAHHVLPGPEVGISSSQVGGTDPWLSPLEKRPVCDAQHNLAQVSGVWFVLPSQDQALSGSFNLLGDGLLLTAMKPDRFPCLLGCLLMAAASVGSNVVPRMTFQRGDPSREVGTFSQEGVLNYDTFLLSADGATLYVGGRDAILALDIRSAPIRLKGKIPWSPRLEKKRECVFKKRSNE